MRWRYTKKSDVDVCNICLTVKPLSDDHVPPQGATEVTEVEVRTLEMFERINPKKPLLLQNGLKFKTVCADCNSRIGTYDKALINLVRAVRPIVDTNVRVPDWATLRVRPNAVIRALAGHLVASKHEHDRARFDEQTRVLLADAHAPIPAEWNVYFWPYPHKDTVVVRDILVKDLDRRIGDLGVCQVLKFHPLAFLVCDSPSLWFLSSLTVARGAPADFESRLPVLPVTMASMHRLWPETPPTTGLVLTGDSGRNAVQATPRRRGTFRLRLK